MNLENHLEARPEAGSPLRVVIETPKGSRNKYAYDPEEKIFTLRKVLPAGMAFPYDFGFVPKTLAGDGDPLDVLLLMDEPAFPGCVVPARLIGVIEGEDNEQGTVHRNDRLIAIAEANHLHANIRDVAELPEQFVRELQDFFVNYLRLEDREYTLLGPKDAAAAHNSLQEAEEAFRKRSEDK